MIFELVRDTYLYRELIWALALKELRVRYKRSALGFCWALLNPLLMMIILTLVFGTMMRFSIDHYAIFLLSMLLPWTFFSQALAYGVESVVGNAELLKKVRVAKMVFPLSAVLANIINFLLSLLPLALLIVLLRFPLHWTWIYLPIPMVGLFLFTLGTCFFFATINVFFRDVSHIVQIILSAWFYLSPIIYSLEFIPHKYRFFFRLNPLLYVLNGFRLSIYYGLLPSPQSVAMSLACGIGAVIIGFGFFRRYQDSFVYYV
ncbi:MAG TPA: ABC transporter permease [Terriglobales bacterium]|nr:ABC transporter permease [Terriglobales bacterium]